ncbi:bifunctional metallophosphatase/5'-nucleotidase [Lacihabitans lacunae]|uniref:Bifunctional metallophosphatase/5'-nucleotidase n=1 Tax=Lacihabitans lacunae TaxID=1028214 RepID=A0ABV7YRE9_9BACT
MNTRRDFIQKTIASMTAVAVPFEEKSIFKETESQTDKPTTSGTLTLLQTTDIHCQIHPHDELFWENEQITFRKTGGYPQIATYIKKEKKKNPNTIAIDTGDMFQGSELSVKTQGEALVPILNYIDYDLYTPGNWEVFFYKKGMQQLLGSLNAPKVCANLFHQNEDGSRGELVFQPYAIINRLGVKIGFLGYTDHLVPRRQPPALSKGLMYTKPDENLKYYVNLLKSQEKCDFIILLSHLGLSQQLALGNNPDIEGVDYIFGGDTHERVRKPIQTKYCKVVEPGAFGSFIGRLDLDIKDGKIVSESYKLIEVDPDKIKPDAVVSKLITESEKPYRAHLDKVLGYSKLPLYRYFVVENTIDTLIVDALKWKVKTDIIISNGFRFCPPKNIEKNGLAPITEGYLYDMLPIDALVRTGEVTGEQILAWLERELENVFAKEAAKRFGGWLIRFKGMEIAFKAFAPEGEKLQKATINGQPIDINRTYTIAACEREGDPEDVICRLKGVKNPNSLDFTLHQAVTDYLKEFSPVNPAPRQSAKILDGPQTLLSQVWGIDYQFV